MPKRTPEEEKAHFESLLLREKELRNDGYLHIAGVDEAGRGPLAGAVYAAAVILPEDIFQKSSPKRKENSFSTKSVKRQLDTR